MGCCFRQQAIPEPMLTKIVTMSYLPCWGLIIIFYLYRWACRQPDLRDKWKQADGCCAVPANDHRADHVVQLPGPRLPCRLFHSEQSSPVQRMVRSPYRWLCAKLWYLQCINDIRKIPLNFITHSSALALVLWHQGISGYTLEYTPLRFQLFIRWWRA